MGTRLGLQRAGARRVRPKGRAAWRRGDKRAAMRRGGVGGARSGVTPCPFVRGLASRFAPLGHAPVGSPLPRQSRLTEASQFIGHGWSKKWDPGDSLAG